MHGLEAEYWGQVDFVYIDVDNPNTNGVQRQYGSSVIPRFVVISPNGQVIDSWNGGRNADDTRSALNYVLSLYPAGQTVNSYENSVDSLFSWALFNYFRLLQYIVHP